MHTLQPGQALQITQPLQNFPLRIGAPSYVLVAGGIGITAILNMVNVLHRLKADYRLVYAGRSRSAMAYLNRLQDQHGDRLHIHADDEHGILDVAGLVNSIKPAAELYMCGPIRLMDAIRRAWSERELDPTNLRYETFGNSGWFDAEPFTVSIPRLGVTAVVGSDESMLQALEREGVEMMFDCRKGECGLCQVKILDLDGQIDHRDVFYSDRQKAPNTKMCACVSRAAKAQGRTPASHPTLISIDVP